MLGVGLLLGGRGVPAVVGLSPRQASPRPVLTTVVGLGDSVVAGSACSCAGFVSDVARTRNSRGLPTVGLNLGSNGMTAAGLERAVQQDRAMAAGLDQADVVLLTVGANDLGPALLRWQAGACRPSCPAPELGPAAQHVANTIKAIQRREGMSHVRIFVSGYWNVFPDGTVGRDRYGPAFQAWSDALTRRLNNALRSVADQDRVTYVDVYRPFKGDDGLADDDALLAPDGDHPNARGHGVLAAAFVRAGAAGG